MNQDALTYLGLSPGQTAQFAGRQRTRLINFLLRWEQYEMALACLDAMIPLNPRQVSLYDAKARALLGLDQADAALDMMRARHEIRTSLTSYRLEVQILLTLKETEAALEIARRLVDEHPQSITAWASLAEVYLARGELDAALAAYRGLADLNPNSRTYLMGMLELYQVRGDQAVASGYAVRLQRGIAEGQSLPAITLRRLRDYFRSSGEINRADDLEIELANLYQAQLAELKTVLADDLMTLPRQPDRSVPLKETPPHVADSAPPTEAMPQLDVAPISDQERQRLAQAARELFGYEGLLPGQAETMAASLRDQHVLTVLPTGGGKSLCYQIPALLDEAGTTLVISPLIALMKDQVDSLPPALRRQATTINSSLDGEELRRRMRGVSNGRFRLVYAAPERLRQPPFLHALRRSGIRRLVVDEAHCLSVWGHDFRPDYLYIAQARQALGDPPVLAMTATAPPRVRRDILRSLRDLGRTKNGGSAEHPLEMALVAKDTYRPNLYLAAIRAQNADEKLQHLLALCHSETGSGIVYAGTRDRCEKIAALLRSRGMSAGYYHAGIGDQKARADAQDTFMSGQVQVMVATVAFGMGIDKADIRFIIHLQLPPSLEAYYQEAGRAGRDGLAARCVLIYSSADRATLTQRAKRDVLPVAFLRAVYGTVKRRLGDAALGRVATGDLLRDLQAEDTAVRVALSMLEEAGLLRRHNDAPRSAVVRLHETHRGARSDQNKGNHQKEWTAFVTTARLQPGQPLPLDPIAVAQAAGLDPTGIESQLLSWADAGWLDYRPAGRELLLELLSPPADATLRVEALIDRQATIHMQRVDEIAAYAATRRCRQGHISAYLSGNPMDECQSCDNCRPDSSSMSKSIAALDLPDECEQLQTVLRCVANTPGGWGPANLTYILRGNSRASPRGHGSPQWSALAFRSSAAVKDLVRRLSDASLLSRRELRHGGAVLRLTPAGQAALQDRTRLAPLLNGAPAPLAERKADSTRKTGLPVDQDGPIDEGLFERLRAWRKKTAQTAGVPPYWVAHDSLLKRIAAIQPRDDAELAEIKGIGPKKLTQYGAAILALVQGKDLEDGP